MLGWILDYPKPNPNLEDINEMDYFAQNNITL